MSPFLCFLVKVLRQRRKVKSSVEPRISEHPASDHGPGCSPWTSQAQNALSTGSNRINREVSSAEIRRTPRVKKKYASPIWNTPR